MKHAQDSAIGEVCIDGVAMIPSFPDVDTAIAVSNLHKKARLTGNKEDWKAWKDAVRHYSGKTNAQNPG
jgi:hypothetical protein